MATKNIDIIIQAKDLASNSIKNIQWSLVWVWETVKTASKYIAWLTVWVVWFWLRSAGQLEQTRIAFENLYWSAEQAGKTIEKLTDFSAKTPFEMPEVADMALKLKNVAWITDDDLIPSLTRLWDIASSQWKSLSQSVEAFLDATTGEFERLKEFWIKASQSGDQVSFTFRWQTETVAKTSDAIGGYLAKIWQMEGIAWWMEKQSATLNWLFSTFKDTISWVARNLVWLSDTWEVIQWWLLDKVKNWLIIVSKTIEDNKDKIKAFGDNIWKVISYVLPFIWEFIENSVEIYKSIKKWTELHPIFTKVTAWITWIATALLLLNANPIWALITAWFLLITNWDKIKLNVWWALYFMLKDFKEKLWAIKKYFVDFIPNLKTWFQILIDKAKQWGKNMIQMFIDWVKQKITDVKNAVTDVANVISDYLGFHSPTKKWPWSDADKWMPNLISMLAQGLREWEPILRDSAVKLASVLWTLNWKNLWIEKIKQTLTSLKWVFADTFSNLWSQIDNSKSKISSLKDEISSLKDKFSDLWKQWSQVESEWKVWLANKAIELEKQLEELKKEWTDQDKIQNTENELALAKQYVNEKQLQDARIEAWKNETQKMIDNLRIKLENIQAERTLVQTQLQEKMALLKEEEDAYKLLNDKRIEFEQQYYNLFQEHITQVKVQLREAISLMDRLNKTKSLTSSQVDNFVDWTRATWWPVSSGWNYLVWEKWPELFVPKQSWTIIPNNAMWWNTININMWWVSVTNSADENRLVEKIKRELTNTLQMAHYWIS